MKLRNLFLGACVAFSASAFAQTENMLVHLKDGSVQRFSVDQVDSVSFSSASADEKDVLNMKVDEVGQLFAAFSANPESGVGTYNIMYLSKSEYDQYKSEDDVVADDLLFFSQYAQYYNMSLSSFLSQMLYSGEMSDFVTGIIPNEDYVIWGYGMDTNGKLTSPFRKLTFHTLPVEKKGGNIAIDVTYASDGTPTVKFTPDDASRNYISGFVADTLSDSYIVDLINQDTSNNLYDYISGESPLSEALADLTDKGERTVQLSGSTAGESYYAVAAYVSDGGAINSELCKSRIVVPSSSTSSVKGIKALRKIAPSAPAKAKVHRLLPKRMALQQSLGK